MTLVELTRIGIATPDLGQVSPQDLLGVGQRAASRRSVRSAAP